MFVSLFMFRNRVEKKLCNLTLHLLSSSFGLVSDNQISRTTRRVIQRSTCRTSPSVRNEVTSDDGSRKTGAPDPEGIRLEIIEGPVAFRAFRAIPPPRSLALLSRRPSFRMHTGCATFVHSRECTRAYRQY